MSSNSRSRISVSKQRGAAMSSRLIPPYAGAIARTMLTISSVSCVSSTTGPASTPPNRLNSAALPSITGIAAAGPMLPRPSTAEPSLTTATVVRLMVRRRASAGFSAIAMQTRATPGVYARDSSSRLRSATFELTSILPPRCSRKVRSDTLRTSTPSSSSRVLTTWSAWLESAVSQVRSTSTLAGSESTTSSAVTIAPASPTQVVRRPIDEASAGTAMRIVIENPALGRRVVTTGCPPALAGGTPHSRSSGISACILVVISVPGTHCQQPSVRIRVVGGVVGWSRPRYVDAPDSATCHDRAEEVTFLRNTYQAPVLDEFEADPTTGELELEERHSLRRVAGLSTELTDITEVEYRQLRLERVVLVGVWTEGTIADAENSLAELAALAETAGSQVLEGLIQRRGRPDPATFIGRGKVDELRDVVVSTGADTVICDGELSPSQLRNLEQQIKVKVVDRTALILDIFAQHAKSKEGKAQVELAQLQYLLPRLRGWGETLSRQTGGSGRGGGAGGGVGLRGPGETK